MKTKFKNKKMMKKTLTFLLIAFTMIGCSSDDDLANNSKLIIGKWKIDSRFLEDGTIENINACEKMSNVTFNKNNTLDVNYYEIIDNDCVLETQDNDIEFKLENGILEVTSFSLNSNGQTTVEVSKSKIVFINSDTLEVSNIIQDNSTNNFFKEIWKRTN